MKKLVVLAALAVVLSGCGAYYETRTFAGSGGYQTTYSSGVGMGVPPAYSNYYGPEPVYVPPPVVVYRPAPVYVPPPPVIIVRRRPYPYYRYW